jgi:pimeloyl-ACP methyl ester carboxylesterase
MAGKSLFTLASKRFRLAGYFFLAAVLVVLTGVVYEQLGEWRDAQRNPQVGSSVDIGGRTLNISCLGEGSPTVVLESNWGFTGYTWLPIQRSLTGFTRVCWYDRAGYGWSDPGPFPNHSDSIARDLHKLLVNAGVPPPYVLVGHAMGAFHVRVFRGYYPSEVAGLVLVDPMNEDMTIQIHNHIEALRPVVLALRRASGAVGLIRWSRPAPGPCLRSYSPHECATLHVLWWQPKSLLAQGKEPPLWISGELARKAGNFGEIPVVVLSAGIQDREEDPQLDHNHALKLELHQKLAVLSTHGRQIVVASSGHNMPMDAPEAVVEAVREVVMQARSLPRPQ